MSFYLRALKHGVQRLFTLPRFSLPILITLSLTLAAVLCVVAMSSNLIFKPLPDLKAPHALYAIDRTISISPDNDMPIFTKKRVALLAKQYKNFGEFSAFTTSNDTVKISEQLFPISKFEATDNFISNVGTRILLGESPNINNSQNSVWISESLWQSAFAKTHSVIGKSLTLADKQLQIRGVMSDFVSFKTKREEKYTQQVWQYYNLPQQAANATSLSVDGSLKLFFRQTQHAFTTDDMTDFWQGYLDEFSEEIGPLKIMFETMNPKSTVSLYKNHLLAEQQTMLWFLLATGIILLLMASLNLLNLFIAHYQCRAQEFATQICVGATHYKLIVMSFLENLSLFILAAFLGLLGAAWVIRILPIISGNTFELLELVQIDSFTIGIALFIGLLINAVFSFLATQQFKTDNLISNLNTGNKGLNTGKATLLGKGLFITQLSFAMVILTGTAMLSNAAFKELNVDLGFEPGNTAIANVILKDHLDDLPEDPKAREKEQQKRFKSSLALKTQLTHIIHEIQPNITVLQSQDEPFGVETSIQINQDTETQKRFTYASKNIGPDYLNTFNIALLAGENISQAQYDNLDKVALVNETYAKQISQDGKITSVIGKKTSDRQIIGVVADNYTFLGKESGYPTLYFTQARSNNYNLRLILQLPEGIEFKQEEILTALSHNAPRIEKVEIKIVAQKWAENTMPQRTQFYFILGLSLLTLLLAAAGSNGMAVSFTELKRFELAIRMATGASRVNILKRTLKSFNTLLLTAILVAIVLACGTYLFLQSFIDMLPEFSWGALSVFTSLLILLVFIVIILVVWRIINKDPMKVLREQ